MENSAAPTQPRSLGQKLLWGCLGVACGLVIVTIIVLLSVGIYARSLYKQVVSDQPTVVVYQPTPEETAKVTEKVRETDAALRRGETVTTEATTAEANTALSTQKHLAQFRDRFTVVKLQENLATIQASVPLDIQGETKYANCEIDLYLKITGGKAEFAIKQVRAKGEPLPAELVKQVEKYGLKQVKEDPQVQREIERIDNFQIKDGKVVMTINPRKRAPGPGPETDPAPEDDSAPEGD